MNRSAVVDSAELIARVSADDLTRPTPCGPWSLAELIAHMAAQHRGFAAAANGKGQSMDVWAVRSAHDAVADYQDSVGEVLEAFAADDVMDRRFSLPEISTGVTFSGERAIGFHLIDYVAHSWDVARALGVEYGPDAHVLAASLAIAEPLPNGPERLQPGAAFAPGRTLDTGVPDMDRFVALLGRSPSWPD